ncbi:helix-turn-helix domain-containing protein [Mucilaginibacter sp. UR6-11]|nr:helix-turn-helix domain-containing protein [Mucilaginibacter sp. UR6-11]
MHNHVDYSVNSLSATQSDGREIRKASEKLNIHHGQVIERAVRCNQMGISEIARRLNVSRRTLYNWFETKQLAPDIIYKIGFVIDYDFSKEFPEEFTKKASSLNVGLLSNSQSTDDKVKDPVYYWMDRYIKLLEKFNELLSHAQSSESKIS